MNEDQKLQDLFAQYKSETSAPDNLRQGVNTYIASKRSGRSHLRWALLGGSVGIAAVIGGTILLSSSASAAGRFKRVEAAIQDAKAMEVYSYAESKGKPRKLYSHLVYLNGETRTDAFMGTRLARTYIRTKSDQWLYMEHNDVAVGEPLMVNPELDKPQSALDFAKADSDEGQITGPREFQVEDRPDENGHSVYAIIGSRKDTPYHLEMIVDKATNLPTRSSFSGEALTSPNYRLIVQEYTFGQGVDSKLFNPQIKSTTKLLHLGVEAEALKRSWAKPLQVVRAKDETCEIRDTWVSHEGNVFIATTVPLILDPKVGSPRNLLPDALKDDLGRSYMLVMTVRPGGYFGDTNAPNEFKIDGKSIVICEYAPLTPMESWPPAKSFKLDLTSRTWISYPSYRESSISANASLDAPMPAEGKLPPYNDAMLLDDVHQQFDMVADEMRANIAEKEKKYALAATWYRAAAEAAKPLSNYRKFLREAERCLTLAKNP